MSLDDVIKHDVFKKTISAINKKNFSQIKTYLNSSIIKPTKQTFLEKFEKLLYAKMPIESAEEWILRKISYGKPPSKNFSKLLWKVGLGSDVFYIDLFAQDLSGKQIDSMIQETLLCFEITNGTKFNIKISSDDFHNWAENEYAQKRINNLQLDGAEVSSSVVYYSWALVILFEFINKLEMKLKNDLKLKEIDFIKTLCLVQQNGKRKPLDEENYKIV